MLVCSCVLRGKGRFERETAARHVEEQRLLQLENTRLAGVAAEEALQKKELADRRDQYDENQKQRSVLKKMKKEHPQMPITARTPF